MPNNYDKEDIKGFAYLDFDNLTVSWNIARGCFCTPTELNEYRFNRNFLSISMAGLLSNSTLARLYSEFSIDVIRAIYFPKTVSRLTGFFIFDEIESIARFWDNNSWGGHFSDEYLSDVGVATTRSTRVDSNWINYIISIDGTLKPDWFSNTLKYWRGDICPPYEPVWERIVEGWLTVWSPKIREEAVKNILSVWPNTSILLQYSSLSALIGSPEGQIFPYLQLDGDDVIINYISKFEKINDTEHLKLIVKNAEKYPSISFQNITQDPDIIGTPDLRNFNTVLSKEALGLLFNTKK